jgi:hypothetical protein
MSVFPANGIKKVSGDVDELLNKKNLCMDRDPGCNGREKDTSNRYFQREIESRN